MSWRDYLGDRGIFQLPSSKYWSTGDGIVDVLPRGSEADDVCVSMRSDIAVLLELERIANALERLADKE